ncbi:methyltransferase [Nonomuraea angiospora]|uniref:methyltransferase n=1 Tax=Nonomuraea angiospora TaxID=46172 RepID=UPI0029B33D08|nr:methyltransferase [Nonomuraea angiospora]MDX3110212.1 methyltransferase [Nonomuraea angiospora]
MTSDDTALDGAAAWRALTPLMDLMTPMALRVAVTLRLPDLVDEHGSDLHDLAARAGADPDALGRVLRHLVGRGVFAEPKPGTFAANGTAALLRRDHPSAAWRWLDLDGFGGRMDLAFTGLQDTVKTGLPAWPAVFGAPFWDHLDADPELSASFDATMAVNAGGRELAEGYDWPALSRVADVGGGTGKLLAELLLRHDGLRGVLIDLPDTVSRARRYLAERGLADRCETVGRSFFDELPAGADAYMLNRVLHDWADAEATAILRRCADAAGPHGRVLILESPSTSEVDPAMFAEMNLRMLVLTGGRERTIDDYRTLAAAAGLRVAAVHDLPPRHTVIECVPDGGDEVRRA